MTKPELLELRNSDLKKRYNFLTGKKNLSIDYTLQTLEKEFYLQQNTIWLIVTGTGYYKKKPLK